MDKTHQMGQGVQDGGRRGVAEGWGLAGREGAGGGGGEGLWGFRPVGGFYVGGLKVTRCKRGKMGVSGEGMWGLGSGESLWRLG